MPRVRETPTRIAPRLTELDPLAAAVAMVFGCRPQVLPGAMDESGTELPEMHSMTKASAAVSQPPEREQSYGGRGDLLGSICPELGVTPLVDPGTDCEDELPALADRPAVDNTDMNSELQCVFVDVVSLPAMITPVSDVDRALDAPEYVDAVIAPAVFQVTSRPPTATTSVGLSRLSPTRPPASVTSERGTPPVVAVPEDFVLFDKAMMSQTQPETSIFPSVYVPSPDVGLVTSVVTPDRTDRLREGPFDAHYDRHGSPASPQFHLRLHSWCRRLRVAYSA